MRVGTFTFLLCLCCGTSSPLAWAQPLDGLEKLKWKPEDWGNPVTFGTKDSAERGHILEAHCQHGEKDKVIFSLNRKWNARERPFLVMDVGSRFESEVGVAIAVSTGPRWNYFESSLRRPSRAGEFQRVVFDLSQPNFKCEKYHWIQGVPIEDVQDVRKLFIVLFPQNRRAMGGTVAWTASE